MQILTVIFYRHLNYKLLMSFFPPNFVKTRIHYSFFKLSNYAPKLRSHVSEFVMPCFGGTFQFTQTCPVASWGHTSISWTEISHRWVSVEEEELWEFNSGLKRLLFLWIVPDAENHDPKTLETYSKSRFACHLSMPLFLDVEMEKL